jgi:hypothetical protein
MGVIFVHIKMKTIPWDEFGVGWTGDKIWKVFIPLIHPLHVEKNLLFYTS